MTREEAIEFGNMWLQINEDCKDSNTYKFFQIAIKTLEEQRWIPVSERLPKIADCYNVTRESEDDSIVSACYFDGINTWHNDNWINHERNYLTDIIAWMPLPKPYKPQESEDKG